MNDIIKYYVQSLSHATETLKKKSILLEKPWALVDNDGAIQKLIFSKDNKLILSKNGIVTEGSWNYHPAAKSLFIDRGPDKLLLNEQYIDENVLILKKDGTDNEFFALANENTLPDYDIPKYLFSINCKLRSIKPYVLANGTKVHYIDGNRTQNFPQIGDKVETLGLDLSSISIPDGAYLSRTKQLTLYVSNGVIIDQQHNKIIKLLNGERLLVHTRFGEPDLISIGTSAHFITEDNQLVPPPDGSFVTECRSRTIIIEKGKVVKSIANEKHRATDGTTYEIARRREFGAYPNAYLNRKITINGNDVKKDRVSFDQQTVLKLENSVIAQVIHLKSYRLSQNFKIDVEHFDYPSFKQGDKIVHTEPVYPIPDGTYKVKGKLFKKITIKDCVVV